MAELVEARSSSRGEPVVALVGPKSSGKTQLKVYLANDAKPVPDYLTQIFRLPAGKEVPSSDPGQLYEGFDPEFQPTVAWEGQRYQQHFPANKNRSEFLVHYDRRNAPGVRIVDFPGEAFENRHKRDEELKKPIEDHRRELQRADAVLLIVPFWHLLPKGAFDELVSQGALSPPAPPGGEAVEKHDPRSANQEVGQTFSSWCDELLALPGERKLIIGISQFGGITLANSLSALVGHRRRTRSLDAVDALFRLKQTVDALWTLDHSPRSGVAPTYGRSPWGAVDRFASSILYLSALRRAGDTFIRACARAGNASAEGLRKLQQRGQGEVIPFNVIDGHPVRFSRGERNRIFFRQDLVNVHLILLKLWQQVVRDTVW